MSFKTVLANRQPWHIETADVLAGLAMLPDNSVQCVVTSPPYHGLRNYGCEGQIGLEPTPQEYIERMAAVFHEVKRVLRPDGTCWVNMGDSYSGSGKGQMSDGSASDRKGAKQGTSEGTLSGGLPKTQAYPAKCLIGQPWRLAFAMVDDGWILRSDIVWAKPAPMPESVTDRPTRSHEYIFLFAKSSRYFYDQEALREPSTGLPQRRFAEKRIGSGPYQQNAVYLSDVPEMQVNLNGRNSRSVWTIGPAPFSEAHFATFPPELPERCIKAGTSERGCCAECGAPWQRVTKREPVPEEIQAQFDAARIRSVEDHGRDDGFTTRKPNYIRQVLGATWQPTCTHEAEPVPCLVLDLFAGSGTTILQAIRMRRRGIGIELSPEYADMARRRIEREGPSKELDLSKPALDLFGEAV